MQTLADLIGQASHGEQVGVAVEEHAVVEVERDLGAHLLCDVVEASDIFGGHGDL